MGSQGMMRISTGLSDVKDLAKVVSFKGRKRLKFWKGQPCNSIKGTDGSLFHPGVTKNETLHVFTSELCQSLPLVYKDETEVQGIPAFRFVPPANVFDNNDSSRECFCTADPNVGCSVPNGLFNMSSCQFGSPIMFSWPHFFQADPALLKTVIGLNPDPEKHQTFIDVQPNFGSTLRASIKSQINLEIQAVDGIKNAEKLRDMILPLAWMVEETHSLEDPESISAVRTAIFLPGRTKQGLYVLFFFGGTLILLTAVLIIVWVKLELNAQKLRNAAESVRNAANAGADNARQLIPEFVAKRIPPEWTLPSSQNRNASTSTDDRRSDSETSSEASSSTATAKTADKLANSQDPIKQIED